MERARGSLEFLGRWNDKRDDRAMAVKLSVYHKDTVTVVRVALGRLVDELVQNGASGGILAISHWNRCRTGPTRSRRGVRAVVFFLVVL